MNPCRILCVHDGPDLQELRDVLEEDGYEVLPAEDSAKAMDVLSSQAVDGVLLDFDLAGAAGSALRNRILHAHPGLPMLLFRNVAEMKQLPLRVFRAYLNAPDAPNALFAHLEN